MLDVLPIIIAAAVSFGLALATLALAKRAGLSTVDHTLAAHQRALVDTLTGRVDHLESENSRLTIENEKLKRELDEVREELRRLERYIVKHKVGDDG